MNKECLVIIPSYNESKTILDVVKKIESLKLVDYIVIDDHSFDTTDLICEKNKLNYIKNEKNIGLSKSMRIGMEYALKNNYKYCIQFDGDGQHDFLTIPRMIEETKKNNINILLTYRKNKKNSDNYHLKKIVWNFFSLIIKWKSKQKINDITCGLRLFDVNFMRQYVVNKKFEVEPATILFCMKKLKMKIFQIETTIYNREHGESTFHNRFKIFKYVVKQFWQISLTTHFWKKVTSNNR